MFMMPPALHYAITLSAQRPRMTPQPMRQIMMSLRAMPF